MAAEARDHNAIKKLVERDGGYSMLVAPTVAFELTSGQLVALRLDWSLILAALVAAYRLCPTVAPIIRTFVDFIRAELVLVNGKPSRRDIIGASPRLAVARHGSRRRGRQRPRQRP